MPTVNTATPAATQASIARAARQTGIDFDYLVAQARLESGMDPSAKAATSSATGLYQFIDSTWLRTLDRHGEKHGLGWIGAAIEDGGHVRDPDMRAQIMALRHDPEISALMAGELAQENAAGLRAQLGREPEPAELYLAHFLGLGGARRFLGALAADPAQSAAGLMPQAAAANRAIFYADGTPRSLGEVMDLMRSKVAGAYAQSGSAPPSSSRLEFSTASGPAAIARVARPAQTDSSYAPGRSMADVIEATFGAAGDRGGGRPGAAIAAAYGRFRAFGL